MAVINENPIINRAYVELKRLSADEQAQKLAENREKALRDEYARNKHAYAKGKTEGVNRLAGLIRKGYDLDTALKMLESEAEL